jgi:hypothetical protein
MVECHENHESWLRYNFQGIQGTPWETGIWKGNQKSILALCTCFHGRMHASVVQWSPNRTTTSASAWLRESYELPVRIVESFLDLDWVHWGHLGFIQRKALHGTPKPIISTERNRFHLATSEEQGRKRLSSVCRASGKDHHDPLTQHQASDLYTNKNWIVQRPGAIRSEVGTAYITFVP